MIKKIAFLFRKLLGSKGPTEEVIAFLETETDIVQLVEAPEKVSQQSLDLQDEALILAPCIYEVEGKLYDCTRPGIYRFAVPQKANHQRVVLDRKNVFTNAKILSLLSIRGNCDNHRAFSEKLSKAAKRFLRLTCTYNSLFVGKLLSQNGFSTRMVQGHTLESLNSFSNGHSLLEFYADFFGKYIVVDVDKKGFFRQGSKVLSMFELCRTIFLGEEFEFVSYAKFSMVDLRFSDLETGFDYSFYEYSQYASSLRMVQTLKRICQVPLISEGGSTYACSWTKEMESIVCGINPRWIILSPESFLEKFYHQGQLPNG